MNNDKVLAAAIEAQRATARARLELMMVERGLSETEGWQVAEMIKTVGDGSAFVFRPVHLRQPSPDLETRVLIAEDGTPVFE